jgi:alkaline phosphatase
LAAPRNIILMIGDGMGPDVSKAAGAYKFGPEYHAFGGQSYLVMEKLKSHLYVTTFSIEGKYDPGWNNGNKEYPKRRPTDSAAAATALATGVKTFDGAIGVDQQKKPLVNIMEIARQKGLKTGVVTTVPFCHATPASFAAHVGNRSDYNLIAGQMLFESKLDLIMGGGHPEAFKKGQEYTYLSQDDWVSLKSSSTLYKLAESREDFKALAEGAKHAKVFGLFKGGSLKYRLADGSGAAPDQPTLAEMTAGALSVLEKGNGFVLMVEGGAIDFANHANNLNQSIGETLGFDEAVATVINWIETHGGWQENLLLITADHDTGYMHNVKPGPAGTLPTVSWGTDGKWLSHTNRLVDLYYQGSGSEILEKLARELLDFERGKVKVIDNTDIFKTMFEALKAGKPSADAGAYSLRRAA